MSDTVSQLQRKFNKKELAQEVFKLRGQVAREEAQDPNIRDAETRAGLAALENVTNLSPEDMASAMTKLGVGVNNTLQTVTSKIIDGRNTLADLERACETKQKELENLFGQEIVARAIGQLLAEHDAKKKEFATKEEELANDVARQESQNQRQQQEWGTQFNKDCERKRQNFQYEFNQEQRQVKDQLAQQLTEERRKFDDEQRQRDRQTAETEADIQKRLLELAEKEQKAATFEEDIKAQYEKDKKSAIDAISRNHKHEMAIAENQATTQQQIAAATIAQQQQRVSAQDIEIESLKQRLAEAQGKNTELANKALESASRSFALDAVMQAGENNGSTRSRGKA